MSGDGRCLCGRTSYHYEGEAKWMVHCHCESCRRATSSAFTSFFGVNDGAWAWTGEPPKTYESSPNVWRDFCAHCGSQMAFRAAHYPGEIHFYAATLKDYAAFKPAAHVHADEAVDWVTLGDDLERR